MIVGPALADFLEAVELEVLLLLEVVEILVEVEELCVKLPSDRTEPLAAAKVVARMTVELFCVVVVE